MVVLSFYRGGWCPYCNMEHALQQSLPESAPAAPNWCDPELPDKTLDTQARHALEFDVLSDRGNRVSEAFGLAFDLAGATAPILARHRHPRVQRRHQFHPAGTGDLRGGQRRVIRFHFVNADYTRRLEPDELLSCAASGRYASPGLT